MKKILAFVLFGITLLSSISSCKKDDDITPSNPTSFSNSVQKGTWKITLFNDNGTDDLSQFSGFSFTFTNGIVVATKNSSKVTGTYSNTIDDSQNKLILNFGAVSPFNELNDDWRILEETASKIRLENVSGGNGKVHLLTFEKE